MNLPDEVIEIITELELAGFSAYVVGGCVRDMIMKRTPNDWDITTSALPADIKKIFERTYDTGIAHGTVTVILNKEHYEVTTYRIEKEYVNFRRPNGVEFAENIAQDLSRRDFTMNAIAYHPHKGFVDPYGGRKDIENKIIRAVGDAKIRFNEDALRILRAVRFAAQLNFEIAEETKTAFIDKRELLKYISKERIRDEFNKICLSENLFFILNIYKWDILSYISGEIKKLFDNLETEQKLVQLLEVMAAMPVNLISRYTALLYPLNDSDAVKHILKELKFDNQTIKNVALAIEYYIYETNFKIDAVEMKRLLRICEVDNVRNILLIKKNKASTIEEIEYIEKLFLLIDHILEQKECYKIKDLAITGNDVIKQNIASGKEIGKKLEQALEFILCFPHKNTNIELINYLMKL